MNLRRHANEMGILDLNGVPSFEMVLRCASRCPLRAQFESGLAERTGIEPVTSGFAKPALSQLS